MYIIHRVSYTYIYIYMYLTSNLLHDALALLDGSHSLMDLGLIGNLLNRIRRHRNLDRSVPKHHPIEAHCRFGVGLLLKLNKCYHPGGGCARHQRHLGLRAVKAG